MAINPNNQIIIDVTQTLVSSPDNYLRRFAVVSNGDTNLASGESKEVTFSDYLDIFNTSTDDTTPEVETPTTPDDDDTTETTSTIAATVSTTAYTDTNTYRWLTSFFTNNNRGTVLVIETSADTVAEAVANLSAFISADTIRAYKYSVPNTFYNEATFVALVQLYSGLTSQRYFSAIVNAEEPSTSDMFKSYNGARNFFAVYPSTVESENVDGAITGIMSSTTFYDLSTSTPLTPLVNKLVSGITPNDTLSNTLETDLVNNNVNYVRTVGGFIVECIGTYLNGTMWEYYYAGDLLQFNLQNTLQTALINAANNPNARIVYNDMAVNTLKAKIEGVIKTLIEYGAITDFGTGTDSNNVLENTGTIDYVTYATYRAANPDNYAAGIYDGFSFAVDIARFILQVKIAIQLN